MKGEKRKVIFGLMMNILKKIFNNKREEKPASVVRITQENINKWPTYLQLYNDGKLRFDKNGRLRYLHGAPVGDLILINTDSSGNPVYKESAEHWFDAGSKNAEMFNWD